MSGKNVKMFELSENAHAFYVTYTKGNMWFCLVHIRHGPYNNESLCVEKPTKEQAIKEARAFVKLRTRYLKNKRHNKKQKKLPSKDDYVPGKVSLDKPLPTAREDDYDYPEENGDSKPYPKVTKEQLDEELGIKKITEDQKLFALACRSGH